MPMKTFTFPIPKRLRERLQAESIRTGAPASEIIRRALDAWLPNSEEMISVNGSSGRPIAELPTKQSRDK